MGDVIEAFWRSLDEVERAQLVGVSLVSVMAFGLRNTILLAVGASVLSQRKPSREAFLPFFERWFKESFCPAMSSRLAQELAERARRRTSFIDSLKDSATSWMVDNSRSLQTALLWDTVQTRSLPGVRFYDLFFMRVATINLGTAAEPMPVSFWGINYVWYLSPLITLNFDGVSVLDALENNRQ